MKQCRAPFDLRQKPCRVSLLLGAASEFCIRSYRKCGVKWARQRDKLGKRASRVGKRDQQELQLGWVRCGAVRSALVCAGQPASVGVALLSCSRLSVVLFVVTAHNP